MSCWRWHETQSLDLQALLTIQLARSPPVPCEIWREALPWGSRQA